MRALWKLIKTLFKIIVWTILIALLLVIILYLSAGKLVQHFAPNFISKVTQTETALGDVDISLLSGKLSINDLAIGNPSGFKDKNIFQLGKIAVDFDPKSIFTNKIVVNSVNISGVNVSSELNAKGKTNISQLLDNVNQFVGASETPKAEKKTAAKTPATKEDTAESKSVVIRDLLIDDSSVRTGIAGQMLQIPLPTIHKKNIGEDQKKTLGQTVQDVLALISSESAKATVKATKEAAQNAFKTGKDTINSIKDNIKNLF